VLHNSREEVVTESDSNVKTRELHFDFDEEDILIATSGMNNNENLVADVVETV